jgi:hypothetical protein
MENQGWGYWPLPKRAKWETFLSCGTFDAYSVSTSVSSVFLSGDAAIEHDGSRKASIAQGLLHRGYCTGVIPQGLTYEAPI